MGPRLHPREAIVSKARINLQERILEWHEANKEELTLMETLAILTDVLSSELKQSFKYEIRYERHGNYDTPGGWA